MLIRTRHFGLYCGRDRMCRPVWYKRTLRIGLIGNDSRGYLSAYCYVFGVEFWLIPNFIWLMQRIEQEPGVPQFHARIIGIQNWPFSMSLTRYPGAGVA